MERYWVSRRPVQAGRRMCRPARKGGQPEHQSTRQQALLERRLARLALVRQAVLHPVVGLPP